MGPLKAKGKSEAPGQPSCWEKMTKTAYKNVGDSQALLALWNQTKVVGPWCEFRDVTQRASRAVIPNLGPPDVLGLQLPEAFTINCSRQDFWELKSKNIWRPKVGDHCYRQ